MAEQTELKTASVLAFERKLDPSDALFRAGNWEHRDQADEWAAIPVRGKSVRGTIGNRLQDQGPGPGQARCPDREPEPPDRGRGRSAQ
ncbi:MAG: type I-F CRISPR-associated protein Cas7f/Csy3 [Arhodomonas sp.]|nr:type I-F CRISPR-associated protein Cas7f/Csy3 [Arhodomonas sp.]